MDTDKLRPNTDEYLAQQNVTKNRPPMQAVIEDKGTKVQRSLLRRFVEFASGRDIKSLEKELNGIVISWFLNSLHSGVESLNDTIFNRTTNRLAKGKGGNTSYDQYYDGKSKSGADISDPSYRRKHGEYIDVEFNDKWKAQEVYTAIRSYFDEYKVLSVANLYQAAGMSTTFTDDAYGWYSLNGSRLEKINGKWRIVMPRPISLAKK